GFPDLRRSRRGPTVRTGLHEVHAMDVDRVAVHAEIGEPYANALPFLHDQWGRPGKDPGMEAEEIELEHRGRIRRSAAEGQIPLMQEDGKVAVDAMPLLLRVDDEEALHAERHLQRLVGMGVVHLRAALTQRELVGEGV